MKFFEKIAEKILKKQAKKWSKFDKDDLDINIKNLTIKVNGPTVCVHVESDLEISKELIYKLYSEKGL